MTMDAIHLYTIGFTRKSAETFFGLLKSAGVRRMVDVRLNVTSQLAGFAKQTDLRYFLRALLEAEYLHLTEAAPTKALLDGFKKGRLSWEEYAEGYRALLEERHAATFLRETIRAGDCFLCSEHEPTHCHRRLLAAYCAAVLRGVAVCHLM
jgi:uncharacterized protein (DUF488 family)